MSAKGLNDRQRRFVAAYRETGNATEASRRAGYTGSDATLAQNGSKLLRNPKVAAAVAKVEAKVEAHALLRREARALLLAQIANGEVDDFEEVKVGEGEKSVEVARARLVTRLKAMDQLSKMSGDYIETRKLVGDGDGPVRVAAVKDATSEMSREELERAARALLTEKP